MTSSENVSIVRKGLDAFQTSDIDGVKAVFSPDIVFRMEPTNGAFEREYHGLDAVLGFFQKLAEMTSEPLRFETLGLADCGPGAVVHRCITRGN